MSAFVPVVVGHTAHAPPSVSLKCSSPHAFRVQPLGKPTRWFRQIGYTLPILSGDRAFDERWSVESDDREFAQALVRERDVRAALARLDALGCRALAHTRRKLVAVLSRQGRTREDRELQETQVREQLGVLDGAVAKICRLHAFPRNGGRLRVVLATIGASALVPLGLLGLALGGDELVTGELGRLILWSLLGSLPLLLVYLLVMGRLLAGRSSSHRDLLVVALTALLALPVLGMGATVTLNRLADPGPPAVHRATVLEITQRHGDGDRVDYYAVVPAWDPGAGPRRAIEISHAQAQQVVTGRSVIVFTTSPGWLGGERLLEKRIETPAGS